MYSSAYEGFVSVANLERQSLTECNRELVDRSGRGGEKSYLHVIMCNRIVKYNKNLVHMKSSFYLYCGIVDTKYEISKCSRNAINQLRRRLAVAKN